MVKLSKIGSGDLSNITTEAILKKIDSFDRVTVTSKLLEYLKRLESDLKPLKKEYEDKLFRIKKPSTFKSNGAQVFSGFIEGVSLDGKLKLRLEDDIIKTYDLKEVELLY